MRYRSLLTLFFALLQLLVAHAQNQPISFNRVDKKDIIYKITSQKDTLRLDLFTDTASIRPRPVVIFIHGGAWARGNKNFENIYYMRSLRDSLMARGYAVLSINYRLVTKTSHLQEAMQDCTDAVRWVRANAQRYGFDTTNIGLWGGSAGAHLALLAAYTGGVQWEDDAMLRRYPAEVHYVVDNFGPTDLNKTLKTEASFLTRFFFKTFFKNLYNLRNKLIFALTAHPIDTEKDQAIRVAKAYSPVHYVDSGAVPTLILHGTKDRIVSFKESRELEKLLAKRGAGRRLIKVDDGDHGFNNIAPQEIDALVQQTLLFIQDNSKEM